MASSAGGSSYEGSGGAAGGKFRKLSFRRPHTTPYDRPRPLAALRNPRRNDWLSKLVVDPASKLISASAHLFFSTLFRKPLPALSTPPLPPPEANQESSHRFQEVVLDNPPGVQRPFVNGGVTSINRGNSCELSELEQILKQTTFTRSEIDRLTELLRSRTVDAPHSDEDNRTGLNVLQPSSTARRQHEFTRSPMQENEIEPHLESHKFHRRVSTSTVSSLIREDEVASPAELAKAYMGSKPSQIPPSRFGLRSQALREDACVLNNAPYTPKSSVMSLVPQSSVRFGVPESGIFTPRYGGRSAIYSMARTPYSRVNSTATQKALKRRSSVLEDNIESVGHIRRLRQKTNLSTPKSLSLRASGSPSPSRENGSDPASAQVRFSLVHNIPSSDGSNHRISKALGENDDKSRPGTSYAPVASKSTETASKILQQLDKLVPKERSSEGNGVSALEKSTSKLMPNGQARRILGDVDSSTILDIANVKDTGNNSLFDARGDTSSQNQDKVENDQKRCIVSSGTCASLGIGNVTVSVHDSKTDCSVSSQSVPQPSQNKRGFTMSAHEDSLELDDEIHSSKTACTLSAAEASKKMETSVAESKAFSSKALMVEKTGAAASGFKPLANGVFGKATDLETSDGNECCESTFGFTFPVVSPSRKTFQVVAASQSTSALDQIVPPKEPSLRNVGEIPTSSFSYSSSASDSSVLTTSAPLEPQPESSNSLANAACAADDSDKGDDKKLQKSGHAAGKRVSSSLPTSTSNDVIFSFGTQSNSTSLNGPLGSSSSIFGSPSLAPASSIFTNPSLTNSFTNVAYSNTAMAASNGSPSTSAASPSFPAAPSFQFGITSVGPTVSITSTAETINLKAKADNEGTSFGNRSPTRATTGSNIFGFRASSTTDTQSQGSLLGTSSVSTPFKFNSSSSAPISGTTETTPFTPSTSLFGSSTSSSGFGLNSSIFNSTTESLPTVFSVSAAATNTAPVVFGSSWGSSFSFTSSAFASASSSQTLPVFGNGDQMNMEDSMAEDHHPVQASSPTIPVFGQNSTPPGFMSGNVFQQNQSTPQNPPLFQTPGSLDFAVGGSSFSLGSGGGDDKANRRIVRVKHKSRRR